MVLFCLARLNSESFFRKLRPQSRSSRFIRLQWLLYKVTPRSNSNLVCLYVSFTGRFYLIPIPTCSGSHDLEGFLTFKFHESANDQDDNVYMGIVQKLLDVVTVKNGKFFLECAPSPQLSPMLTSCFSEPAARAVWETVMRARESPSVSNDPEPMLVDIPIENSPNPPLKPRARLRP